MKRLNFLLVVIIMLLIGSTFTSCETENPTLSTKENLTTTSDSHAKNGLTSSSDFYSCSELAGGYMSGIYITHGVYINPSYVPSPNPNPLRFASWMVDLETWLHHDFNDANPSGSNSSSFFISAYVDGTNGGGDVNATDGNRAYNEFVCQLMNQLGVSSASDLSNYEFSTDVYIGYNLCCDSPGHPCCGRPYLEAIGTAYWD